MVIRSFILGLLLAGADVPLPPSGLAVDAYFAVPEVPGNGIDDNLDGTKDEAITPCWTANNADYYCEAEGAQFLSPMVSAADTDASGGDYVHLPSGNHFASTQMRLPGATITNATYYIFARVRNPGSAKRIWFDTSTISRYPNNATLGATIPQLETFTWVPLGTAGTLADFGLKQNATAQRTLALDGTIGVSIMSEPGIHFDKFCISPNANAITQGATDATLCSSAAVQTVNYEVLDIGAVSMPTIDGTIDAIWAVVPPVNYSGLTGGSFAGSPVTRCVWDKDATPKRIACLHTYTLANLTSTVTADDTDLSGDTASYIYFKLTNLDRVYDADTYLVGVNMNATQAVLDANWPSASISTTVDLGNFTHGRSYAANVLVIEYAFDLPGTPTADQLFLLNFRANERVTGQETAWKGAFNVAPADSYEISAWGIGKLSSTVVPEAPADSTAPSVTNCSAINIGNDSYDLRCDIDEAGTGIVYRDSVDDGAVATGSNPSGTVNCSGANCTVNVSGLTQGTLYESKMCVTDAAGNPGCGSVIDTTTTSTTQRFVSVNGTGTEAGTSCADTNDASRCPLSQIAVRASPGETWILKDGTYSNIQINANCAAGGTGAANGTASSPVVIKAENERLAYIKTTGSISPIQILNCSHWRFEGIRAAGGNSATASGFEPGAVVALQNTSNLTFRRNLFANPNANFNAHVIGALTVSNSLFEENEFYNFHRHGIRFNNGGFNVLRRNYCNTRGVPSQGSCMTFYPSNNNLAENNIAEARPLVEMPSPAESSTNIDNRFVGNIARGASLVNMSCRGNTVQAMPRNTVFENSVVYDPATIAMYVRAAKNTIIRNATVIDSNSHGIAADIPSDCQGDGSPTIAVESSLVTNNAGTGVLMISQSVATIEFNNAVSNAQGNFSGGTQSNNTSTTPTNLGGCVVYIPSTSNMKGAGKNGADKGANVLYAYENGVLGSTKLWNSANGKWNTALIGASVNDGDLNTVTNSIRDIEARLHPTCTWAGAPVGY